MRTYQGQQLDSIFCKAADVTIVRRDADFSNLSITNEAHDARIIHVEDAPLDCPLREQDLRGLGNFTVCATCTYAVVESLELL
jgi:hypothetical protein